MSNEFDKLISSVLRKVKADGSEWREIKHKRFATEVLGKLYQLQSRSLAENEYGILGILSICSDWLLDEIRKTGEKEKDEQSNK